MTKGHKPAGGIKSRVNVSPGIRTGSGSHSTRPGYVSQLGNKIGDHITERGGGSTGYKGEKMHDGKDFHPVMLGNAKALDVGKGGCGTGRDVHKTGSQQQWGQPAPGNPPAQRKSFD